MALGQRINALHKRHEWLDGVLVEEMHHPHPDEIRIAQIKKSKLRVKDEITLLERMENHYLSINDDVPQLRKRAVRH
ncbi:MAG: DUF465 domain-containing protein [Alphaproteobacteria bacterium]|nr:DUF465 domain-containing protein [Alphaproteobacteria bacterium]